MKTEKERGGKNMTIDFPIANWGAWKSPQSMARISRSWKFHSSLWSGVLNSFSSTPGESFFSLPLFCLNDNCVTCVVGRRVRKLSCWLFGWRPVPPSLPSWISTMEHTRRELTLTNCLPQCSLSCSFSIWKRKEMGTRNSHSPASSMGFKRSACLGTLCFTLLCTSSIYSFYTKLSCFRPIVLLTERTDYEP